MSEAYDDLPPQPANYVPLSPISFLARAAQVFADSEAVVHGDRRFSWRDVNRRCCAVASALRARGIARNSTVSILAPNLPEVFELHYAIPMAGGVINAINTRLDADTIAWILEHGESELVFVDTSLVPLLDAAFGVFGRRLSVVTIGGVTESTSSDDTDYETLLESGEPDAPAALPHDEWDAIALNYTSGTSGRPKGVVYHHRGAWLMSMSTLVAWSVPQRPVFLSVSPLFHCNGWHHPWAMSIVGARLVFTDNTDAAALFAAMRNERVTHFGAAPIVLSTLAESAAAPMEPFSPPIQVMTAGAPPPPSVLERTAAMGMRVMQIYGLTETFGHIAQCLWRSEWQELSAAEQASRQALQGVAFPMTEHLAVLDTETGEAVPSDGCTNGEIVIRGNTVMKGYFKDSVASADAFRDGYFHSGDAAVVDGHGYLQIRDRFKDVIISGGENISSVEIEAAVSAHPAVRAAAVVAMPSEKWGESPCAFVELKGGARATSDEILEFARERLAGFKRPKAVVFGPLPKTATGKIQKYLLRDNARELIESGDLKS